jgi:hypothetical protein
MKMRGALPANMSDPGAPTRAGSRSFVRTLGRLAWLFLRHPGRAVDELRADPRALFLGLAFLVAGLAVYTVVAARIYSLGYRPRAVPLTLFPSETWYLLQAFITIPVGVVAAFAFSGMAYALCRACGGGGTFDATFGVSAFSLHLPMLIFMWLPEIFVAPALYGRGGQGLPWPMWIEVLRIFLVPLPWAGIVATLGLSRVHGLSLARSGLAVLVAAVPTSLMTAAFLR